MKKLLHGHVARGHVGEANCETEDAQEAMIFIRPARSTVCRLRCSMVNAIQPVRHIKTACTNTRRGDCAAPGCVLRSYRISPLRHEMIGGCISVDTAHFVPIVDSVHRDINSPLNAICLLTTVGRLTLYL